MSTKSKKNHFKPSLKGSNVPMLELQKSNALLETFEMELSKVLGYDQERLVFEYLMAPGDKLRKTLLACLGNTSSFSEITRFIGIRKASKISISSPNLQGRKGEHALGANIQIQFKDEVGQELTERFLKVKQSQYGSLFYFSPSKKTFEIRLRFKESILKTHIKTHIKTQKQIKNRPRKPRELNA